MKFISTNKNSPAVDFKTAIFSNLAPDGGLYFFESLPTVTEAELLTLKNKTFKEISFFLAKKLLADCVKDKILEDVINSSLNFNAEVVPLKKSGNLTDLFALELFHGPTHAFKDFAAQFMAKLMVELRDGEPMTILVATSGDTGSAVAEAFWNLPNVNVRLLFPKGYVSPVQEAQLTSFDNNVQAFECEGNFDDCQRLVKTAFMDSELSKELNLVSANSINLARLIPQTFYYFSSFLEIQSKYPQYKEFVYSVPSGNFGNLTAGVLSKKIGLPIGHFIASTNLNKVVPEYLNSGEFKINEIVHTISNAMDVANPSNFTRIKHLYGDSLQGDSIEKIKADMHGFYFSDDQTKSGIKELWNNYSYLAEPHTAIGYLGVKRYFEESQDLKNSVTMHNSPVAKIFLGTAHPAKFPESVNEVIGTAPPIPVTLAEKLSRKKTVLPMQNSFDALKQALKGTLVIFFYLTIFIANLFFSPLVKHVYSQDVYLKNKKSEYNQDIRNEDIVKEKQTNETYDATSPSDTELGSVRELGATKDFDSVKDFGGVKDSHTDNDSQSNPTSEILHKDKPTNEEELLIFEVGLAERNYNNQKNDLSLSELVSAQRKLVIYYCFNRLRSELVNFPAENSPKCQTSIQKLFDHDSHDQIALCAKYGFESDSCKNSEKLVTIKNRDIHLLTQNERLDAELNKKKELEKTAAEESKFNTSLTSYYQLQTRGQNATTEQSAKNQQLKLMLKKELLDSGYKLLTYSCKNDKYLLKTMKDSSLETPVKEVPKKEILSMELFNTQKPTPQFAQDTGKFTRTRMLSEKCTQYIDKIKRVDPTFSSAICAYYGTYSPSCISARKAALAKAPSGTLAKQKIITVGDGMAEF